jgi:hypothetical protein
MAGTSPTMTGGGDRPTIQAHGSAPAALPVNAKAPES